MTTSYQYEPNSKGQSKHNKSTFPKTSEFLFSNRKKKNRDRTKKKKNPQPTKKTKKKNKKKNPQTKPQKQKIYIT